MPVEEEKQNWFITRIVKVPYMRWIVDEIQCALCNFAIKPKKGYTPQELENCREQVINHAKSSHTIQEFYDIWDGDEIWDAYSFEQNLFSSKSHPEETGKFYEREIPPKIDLFGLGFILFMIFIVVFLIWLSLIGVF